MSRLRIALLNAAHDGADTRRNFRRDVPADLVEYNVTTGELPETMAFDGCIVTGSRDSVYWDDPWIRNLKSWVREAVGSEMPFFGVCFGHQLLASVLGGTVEDMAEYEIGYRQVNRCGSSPLFDGIDRNFTVFTSHSDCVTELPGGATVLAENEYGVHSFRKGNVFGVQFHPEYDGTTARQVTLGKTELSENRIDEVLDGITAENELAACEAKMVLENFAQFVDRHRHENRYEIEPATD